MSLRVWLPLTKDLRQQGLDSTTVTQNSGTAISSGGKLGSCLTATSNATIVVNLPSLATMLANGKSYSLACWVKVTNKVTNGWVIKLGTNSCGLWWAASEARWSWNENDGGKRCANPTISSDTTNWHHLVTTVTKSSNGSTTTARHYVDGKPATSYEVQTWDGSGNTQPAGTTITISPYVASLNDIRLYDHCLSEAEIKKLAQGLILHYPLNRGGMGQENLWRNGSCQDNLDGMLQSTVKFTITTKDGYKCAHLSGVKGSSNVTGYLSIPDTMVPEAGAWYTISADMRIDNYSAGSTNPYVGIYFSGDYLNTDNTGGWYGGSSYSGDGMAAGNVFVNTYNNKGWHRVTCTAQYLHGGSEYKKGAFRLGYIYARDFTGDLYVKNIKFEKGKIATPWCPNVSDELATTMGLNDSIEYDISGYCNNGTRTGTFSWTSDTPKYEVSTEFQNGTTATISPIFSSTTRHKQLTFATWVKRSSDDANYHYYWNNGGVKLGIRAYNNVNNYYLVAWTHATDSTYEDHGWVSTVMPKDTWIHVVWVFDSGVWKQYVNGVLNGTRNDSSYGTYVYGDVGSILGNSWIGNLSDFRIYATALSADDVKSLYQNCATIGPDGTIYGQLRN